ncbi:MAG: molybdopterin converting factor subunit 1 [Hyphomicrobiales bacterium]
MKILYFAWVREKVGKPFETVDVPEHVETVAQLIDWLKGRGEEYQFAFEDISAIRAGINQQHQPLDAQIKGATEVAFFPPVTGG